MLSGTCTRKSKYGSTCGNRRLVRLNAWVLILGHLTLLWLTPERVFGKWLRIGIPIEQCARTWRGDRLHYLTWEREAPGYHPPSLFFSSASPPGGSRPHAPLTKNHKPRVGPAHKLFSVIYTTIPSRRPSVKDIVGYVKKFISFYFDRGPCITSLNILYKIN